MPLKLPVVIQYSGNNFRKKECHDIFYAPLLNKKFRVLFTHSVCLRQFLVQINFIRKGNLLQDSALLKIQINSFLISSGILRKRMREIFGDIIMWFWKRKTDSREGRLIFKKIQWYYNPPFAHFFFFVVVHTLPTLDWLKINIAIRMVLIFARKYELQWLSS